MPCMKKCSRNRENPIAISTCVLRIMNAMSDISSVGATVKATYNAPTTMKNRCST